MGRHLVILDCNIFLDVARLTGSPYTADRLSELAVEHSGQPVPHPVDRAVDSLRLIAACQSGKLSASESLEVCSSNHIRQTIEYKAWQSATPDPVSGHRGLGWSREDAEVLVEDLVDWIVEKSSGKHLSDVIGAIDNPPLDHEDGTVYGACKRLEGDNPLATVFCVTRDKGFLKAYANGELSGYIVVCTPAAMLDLIRRKRRGVMPRLPSGR